MRAAMAAGVPLALLGLGACGDDDDDAGVAPSPDVSVSSDPSLAASSAPTVNPRDKIRRNWLLVSLSKDERTLTLRWDTRTCSTTPDLTKGPSTAQTDLSETDDEVEILTSQYVEAQDCKAGPPAEWRTKSSVRLDDPLGDRRLVGCTPDPETDCTKDWTKD